MDPRIWGAIALLVGAFAAGALVNGWRLESGHAKEIATLTKERDDLATQIREQNHAVDTMKALSEAADSRRKLAEGMAQTALQQINDRAAAVTASKAPDCDGVLREAWK
jgi:hypothetical protein